LKEKMQKTFSRLCVRVPSPAKGAFITYVNSSICAVPGRQPGTDCQRVVEKLKYEYSHIVRKMVVIPNGIKHPH
jgi:hypothetical protein